MRRRKRYLLSEDWYFTWKWAQPFARERGAWRRRRRGVRNDASNIMRPEDNGQNRLCVSIVVF